ncbi:hypothetical protein ABZY09_42970 [Streptomyces sp. NPDC002928]|uniref:hypothetical protein n=1 Tax=Streptomyces sp. NPDC002928 TaxID=3154440 RepID=UPI0033AE82D5
MQIDDAGSVRPNSVLLDNTTLFTCLPLASEQARRECSWVGKWWAEDLVDRGMSNLVESLILHEAVYVDGEQRYHAPAVGEISELFPGLVRGVGVGADRGPVMGQVSRAMSGGEEIGRRLYSIAYRASRSRHSREPLHLSHIFGFLHTEIAGTAQPDYVPESHQIEPMVFRTFFYLALSALTGLPYTPYSLRNPILLALAEHDFTTVARGSDRRFSSDYYAEIAVGLLQSFDDHVRAALSDQLQAGPVSLPVLAMPSFWEMVKEGSADPRALADRVLELRERAASYRMYVGRLSAAYASGDLRLVQEQHQLLAELTRQLNSTMRIPRVEWKRFVVPVRVKSPFVELDQLSFKVPTLSRLREPHFVFLHDWTARRF